MNPTREDIYRRVMAATADAWSSDEESDADVGVPIDQIPQEFRQSTYSVPPANSTLTHKVLPGWAAKVGRFVADQHGRPVYTRDPSEPKQDT